MLYSGLDDILRVIWVGMAGYVALVFLLRITGKRTLSKMNAFDLVVTVALGSTFATLLLSRDTSLATGVTALAVLGWQPERDPEKRGRRGGIAQHASAGLGPRTDQVERLTHGCAA